MCSEGLDVRLVNALLADGRASYRTVADVLNVSETTVANHVDRLVERGYIRGFVPLIDYDAFGYDVAVLSHLKVEGGAYDAIAQRLVEIEQFLSVYVVTGDYDLTLLGRFETTGDMNRHIKRLLDDPAVRETNTSLVLDTVRDYEPFALAVEDG